MLRSYLYIMPLLLLTGCQCELKVKKLDVPSLIQLGKEDYVILDCEYSLDEPSGLVVKWFVDKLNLVYQWIAHPSGNLPQDLGLLKGKIDIGYKASSDPLHAHRAIKILNPTVDMSGNYTCVVSTFVSEDSMTKSMLVYSIVSDSIQFTYETIGNNVRILCLVEDVYPKPTITVMVNSDTLDLLSPDIELVGGLYRVKAEAQLSASDLAEGAELECRMTFAQINRTEAKRAVYYAGADSTEQLAAVEAGVAQRPFGDGSTACRFHSLFSLVGLAAMALAVRTTHF